MGTYDLDVALEILAQMKARKRREYNNSYNSEQKEQIKKEINILKTEREALCFDSLTQQSVIDKAFKVYAPILKAERTVEYAKV